MGKVSGHCYCEAIRFKVDGPEKFACFCYCKSCQRAAGAPVVAWAIYDRSSFDVLQGELHWHSTSAGVTRGICRECGSSMTYENANRPGDIDVSVNCLDGPSVPAMRAHIWTEDKQPWFEIGDDLPVYKKSVK